MQQKGDIKINYILLEFIPSKKWAIIDLHVKEKLSYSKRNVFIYKIKSAIKIFLKMWKYIVQVFRYS